MTHKSLRIKVNVKSIPAHLNDRLTSDQKTCVTPTGGTDLSPHQTTRDKIHLYVLHPDLKHGSDVERPS